MAQTLKHRVVNVTFFILSSLLLAQSHQFSNNLSPKSVGLKKQKLTHLHFYFHDLVSGEHPTAFQVAKANITNTSSTFFGFVAVMDDPLTVGPELTSKIVGRAQGIYSSASLNDVRLLMVLNYVFVEGKYNGSTLSILGVNAIFAQVREMPIVGGSGIFRFARGYALAKTYTFNTSTGNAVVEYNVYVQHY